MRQPHTEILSQKGKKLENLKIFLYHFIKEQCTPQVIRRGKKPRLQHQYRHTGTKVRERHSGNVGYLISLYTHTCFRKQLSCLSFRLCLPAWPSSITMSPAHPHPGDLGTSKRRQTHPFLIRFEGPNGQLLQFRSGYAACWATEHRNKSSLNTAHSFTQLSRHHLSPCIPI